MASVRSILKASLALPALAAASQYEEYILAPSSRTIHPVAVYGNVNGTVSGASSIAGSVPGSALFQGAGSAVTYDFGKNIGGLVSLTLGNGTDPDQYVGVTFSESSLWVSGVGCDATEDSGIDEPLWFQPSGPGVYSADRQHERGGFRYLSIIHNTTGNVEVNQISIEFTPMPHYAEDELRNYTGFFHCDGESCVMSRNEHPLTYSQTSC